MLLCHRPALPLGSTARLPTAHDSAAAICHKAQAGFCDPVLCDPAPDRSHGVRAVTPTFARLRTSGSKRPAPERASVCTRAEGGPSASGIEDRSFSDDARSSGVEIPTHLNSVPHAREARQFFYRDVSAAAQAAIQDGQHHFQLRCTIPELNPAMDVYRIGTLLELAREIASALAQDGAHVKVCVQQSMGQGVFQGLPLSLSGVRRIMEAMDWGDIEDFVHFGEVGAHMVDECRHYVLLAPQNLVGTTIMTNLHEMVDKAEETGKFVALINPILKDIPSADGVMGIRGRKERMEYERSFEQAYHFRLLYMSSAMMYPIMGALRHCHGGSWEVYKRIQLGKRQEEYRLVAEFDEEPVGKALTSLFLRN